MRAVAAAFVLSAALGGCASAPQPTQAELIEQRGAELAVALDESAAQMAEYRARRVAEEKAKCSKGNGVAVGMSPDQVRKSCWGKPKMVNETTTARGSHQQWVYGGGYVYLDNGVVTSIQTSSR